MILIGLGANLASPEHGAPEATLRAALEILAENGVATRLCSRWYCSPPVPASDQPWFVNAVARVETELAPEALLALLHDVESRLGRRRRVRWEARIVDLDLLCYGDLVGGSEPGSELELPHPRMHQRAFVLVPLAEVAPGWRHPTLHRTVETLIAELAPADVAAVAPLAPAARPAAGT
ncbi:MAG: 2-amino-4-hydroxy-6-hydroxymethyldihydropteridine diphosphokinase [Alphaproteobacteria bacterium]|jgi:2-amino-4-hydroxy-6-hydroxymethyldihydropteridine diphosphokinase|nr:2-amino-4-hydroxy-6-hydroxymethyldihydropteridine diphosphokinase [Alphaproteobacteria bacterium]